ncbi:hypothetical protein ACFVZH_35935 [Streptomyces sp. NPDC059534]|uniref:hypothetical protein n=1 Tax=Streptomyces sp. NPDC059534 TaxID=3346859 RepID=UPI0036A1085B
MWIDRLVEVTHREPVRADMAWGETEESLGLALPEDYKRLYAPYRLYQPGQVGLIPWGFSQTEGEYYWLTGGEEPSKWPIVTRGRGYREWHQVDMSTPEFIYRVVADPQFEPFSIAAVVPEPFFAPAPEKHVLNLTLVRRVTRSVDPGSVGAAAVLPSLGASP